MRKEDIKKYLGKIIFVRLNNNNFYTCKIININEESIDIIDKYKLNSTINISDIISITDFKEVEE